MKKIILVALTTLFIIGCNKTSNKLGIVLSKTNVLDSAKIKLVHLYLKNSDSIVYKIDRPTYFSFRDTIKLDSLRDGNYELDYLNIAGDKIKRDFSLNNGSVKFVNIIYDSLALMKIYTKVPINQIKEGESYTVDKRGGCVASMYSGHYFESVNITKKLLDERQIKAIERFEAELLAIRGKGVCGGTGAMTYRVIKDRNVVDEIRDYTCDWNGYETMMLQVNK